MALELGLRLELGLKLELELDSKEVVVVEGRVNVGGLVTMLLLCFLEPTVPPTAPPTVAPITMIAAISMKTLHFF